jgi:MFS family permease
MQGPARDRGHPAPQVTRASRDSRRGWLVVWILFINLAVIYGAWYSYAVFLVALVKEFAWSHSVVSGGFSVFVMVHGSLGPLSGWLASRVGARRLILVGGCLVGAGLLLAGQVQAWWHLYLAFGVVTALGIGLSGWIPTVLITRGWFPDRVGTAVGVVSAGIGIGMSGLVPLAQYLIDWCGWRWTYRVLGVLIAGWVVPATFFLVKDPPLEGAGAAATPGAPARGGTQRDYWTLATAVRDGHFWALAGVFFSGNVATQMLLVHQVAYLVGHGVTPLAAAAVGTAVGLASIVGKMAWGAMSDRTGREVAYSLAFSCTAASVGALALAGEYPQTLLPYVYGILIGLGYAGTAPLTPAAASDLFRGPGFSMIFGTLHLMLTIGAAVGSWGAGRIFDWTGSYALALVMGLIASVIAPALMWVAAPRRPHPPPAPMK